MVFTIAAGGYLMYVIVNHCKNKDSVDAIIEDIKAAKEDTYETYRVYPEATSSQNDSPTNIKQPNPKVKATLKQVHPTQNRRKGKRR